jgi:hypothetical protein
MPHALHAAVDGCKQRREVAYIRQLEMDHGWSRILECRISDIWVVYEEAGDTNDDCDWW